MGLVWQLLREQEAFSLLQISFPLLLQLLSVARFSHES